jgi:hypothetical protein
MLALARADISSCTRVKSSTDTARATSGNLSGLWLSRYSYFSSGRDAKLQGEHTIRLLNTGSWA